jgi:hypothetical protein
MGVVIGLIRSGSAGELMAKKKPVVSSEQLAALRERYKVLRKT